MVFLFPYLRFRAANAWYQNDRREYFMFNTNIYLFPKLSFDHTNVFVNVGSI